MTGRRCRNAGAFHPIRPEAAPRPTFPIKGKDLALGIDQGAYRVENGIDVVIDFMVPCTEHCEALLPQPIISHRVSGRVVIECVLTTIELDNDFGAKAGKIDDVSTKRDLPAELDPVSSPIMETGPDSHLMRRHTLTQRPGMLGQRALHATRQT